MSLRLLPFLLLLSLASCTAPTPSSPPAAPTPAKPPALPTALPPAPASYDSPQPAIPHGTVLSVEYPSKTSGITRKAILYLPPGYNPATKYPVLYLVHGAGGDETRWTATGAVDAILDNLYALHKPVPMIVVMPNLFAPLAGATPPAAGRGRGAAAGGASTAGFEGDLLTDLMPYIDAHYPILPGRQNRALVGLSLGGAQALSIGLHHLDLFAWIGGFSPALNAASSRGSRGTAPPAPSRGTASSPSASPASPADALIPDPAAAAQLRLLWLSCGTSDPLLSAVQSFHTSLDSKSIPHSWHTQSGQHEWPVWKTDLYYLAPLLFQN